MKTVLLCCFFRRSRKSCVTQGVNQALANALTERLAAYIDHTAVNVTSGSFSLNRLDVKLLFAISVSLNII